MNGINSIMITPVANGWVVQLPDYRHDPDDMFNRQIKAGVKFAKGLTEDPMLQPKEEEQEESADIVQIKKENGTHVFETFDEVLSFLKYKIAE